MAKEREVEGNGERMEATIRFDDLKLKRDEKEVVSDMHARDHAFSKTLNEGATLEVEHCLPEATLAILDAKNEMSLRNILEVCGAFLTFLNPK